jgi:predicted DNA-binding transcriptional regulator YafY
MHPLERLVNLVALLLEARRPLTFEQIRQLMPAYQQEDVASAKRMFERDKDTLRDVGVPVELTSTDAWDVEQGYRIPKERFYLPELAFTPDEVWALFVAAHAPGEDGEARHAFWKLATGVDTTLLSAMTDRPTPGVDASGPHLGTVADALARRRALRFNYRPLQGKAGRREIDPYRLLFQHGTWYVVGRDRARDDIRSYRLSRITGPVRDAGPAEPAPEGFDAREHLRSGPWGLGEPDEVARVAFSPKVAWWAIPATPGARVVATMGDGWVEADVPGSRSESFVSWVLSFGPDARLEAPADLRARVVAALRGLAGVEDPA